MSWVEENLRLLDDNDSKDPFAEHEISYIPKDADTSFDFCSNREIDNKVHAHFQQIMRTQIQPKVISKGCSLHYIFEPSSIKVNLNTEYNNDCDSSMVIQLANLFSNIGYNVDIYWVVSPYSSLRFDRRGNAIEDNLLYAEEFYVTPLIDSTHSLGAIQHHEQEKKVLYKVKSLPICMVQ